MFSFQWPVRTVFGTGCVGQVGELASAWPDRSRALIVSAPDAWCNTLVDRLAGLLTLAGYHSVERFGEIESNPSWETVRRGAQVCKRAEANCIVAVGGGSAIDASKVIALQAGISHLIVIPTTAGTGSELNEWGVITNTTSRIKESVQATWPSLALLDPELGLSMPPAVTLFTGVDAFCHALECYVSTTANPITDALALQAMELAARWLPSAVADGSDLAARTGMLQTSLLGGATMLGAGLGLMHGIGNIAGGLNHAPHGLILTHLLGPVMRFNQPGIPAAKLARIQPFLDVILALAESELARLQIPPVALAEEDLAVLAQHASINVNSRTNPRPFQLADIIELARESLVIVPGSTAHGD